MATKARWSHEAEWPAEAINVGGARAYVRMALFDHGLERFYHPVQLVVSELTTNAVRYAGTAFRLSIEQVEDTLVVRIGHGSHHLGSMDEESDQFTIGGWALEIVAAVSDDWGVDQAPDGSKSVWAGFRIH